MTLKTTTALGAGSIAFAAGAQAPFGFGHRPRFFFQAPGEGGGDAGGDGGADTGGDAGGDNDVTVDSALTEAFAEIAAGQSDTNSDTTTARPDAAAAEVAKNPNETPAAATDQAAATPDRWTAEEQAEFAKLPPEAKALVEKKVAAIEADYQQKAEGSAEAVKLAEEVRSVVDADFQRKLDESGMTVGQGVKYLADLERFANSRPAEYLAFVAQHVQKMGVDVMKVLGLSGAQPAAGDDAFQDPRVGQLEERLGSLTTQMREDAQRRALDAAGQTIAGFRDAKDASGNPLRPHFADVENDMAALIRANPKMDLDKAYEAAVWSNPAVRTRLQEADRAAAAQKARDDAAAAQKAIRSNVRPGTRSMRPSQQVDTVDDAVDQAFAEIKR
ncbi:MULTISPECIES: hypothetical protein [unclassified Aureimonas]|uniref:hypothetical protein n=1 Tax=unclassified Aureimonas TaxID=2615206 RepID=UPI0006FCEE5E|nr:MULTISPECIES: hypothetical protein [unclassified Aureimonas]KQT52264.1 hypothetical protein ASG62_16545 [Aureimonas sp. Leaf427]KQT73238.1 hypothetical protein ASG54_17820 [Aureimonas sp. Leaf460]